MRKGNGFVVIGTVLMVLAGFMGYTGYKAAQEGFYRRPDAGEIAIAHLEARGTRPSCQYVANYIDKRLDKKNIRHWIRDGKIRGDGHVRILSWDKTKAYDTNQEPMTDYKDYDGLLNDVYDKDGKFTTIWYVKKG